jgi:hypothetical protein
MSTCNSYILLVDWSNGTSEYIEAINQTDCNRYLSILRQSSEIELIRIIVNPSISIISLENLENLS